MSNNNIDINSFMENMKDLNDIAKQISDQMENKNQILKGGLKDSNKYRKVIEKKDKEISSIRSVSSQKSEKSRYQNGKSKK